MSVGWQRVRSADILPPTEKRKGHTWRKPKVFHWEYCTYCGIITLNNNETRKHIKLGCK